MSRVDTMTPRARAYIVITAVQHGLVGASATLLSQQFNGDGFRVARELMPIPVWGLMFLAGSGMLMQAAVRGSESRARLGMVLSVLLIALLGASLALSYTEGGVVSPIGTVFALSLMAKDLVVCAQPMRSPFERVVEEYVGPARPHR